MQNTQSKIRPAQDAYPGREHREHQVDLDAYFHRIGYTGSGSPTLKTLLDIHARHIDAIPFEAIDVLSGQGTDIALPVIERKLVGDGRGGYCLEQNPLLMTVLRQLGYRVEGLSARVRWQLPPDAATTARSHAALSVTIDNRRWLVDAGFGAAVIPRPLALATSAPQTTAHETYRLLPLGNQYRLQAQRQGAWHTLYDLHDDPLSPADYEMMNWFTSRHPDSHFRRQLIVARTRPDRRYVLRDGRLTISRGDRIIEQRQLDAEGLENCLRSVFELPVSPEWRPLLARATAAR